MNSTNKPPLEPRDWLAYVLAAQALRSTNPGQQKLGDELIDRYFRKLPERLEGDETGRAYMEAMLCHVAAAMRGFSVVRDIFQTRWGTMSKARDLNLEATKKLESFAPLSRENHWGKAAAIISGLGVSAGALSTLQRASEAAPWVVVLVLLGGIGVALIALQFLVLARVHKQTIEVETSFPDELRVKWRDESVRDYKNLSAHFLRSASEVTKRHYPEWEATSDSEDAALVESAFSNICVD